MNVFDPPKPRRKTLWLLIKIAISILIVIGASLATGWPQRKLVEFALERTLGADVHVARVQILGTLRINSLGIADSSQESHSPALVASGITIAYSLFPDDGRYIQSLSIQDLKVHFDITNPEDTNFNFLIQEPDENSSDDTAFLPKNLTVSNLLVAVSQWEQGQLELSGLSLSGDVRDALNQAISLQSESAQLTWTPKPFTDRVTLTEGPVNLQVQLADERIEINIDKLDLPGLITVEQGAQLRVAMDPAASAQSLLRQIDLTAQSVRIEGQTLAQHFGEFLPMPITFDSISFADLDLHASREDGPYIFKESRFDLATSGLVVGEADHALFGRDLRIHGEGDEASSKVSVFIDELEPLQIVSTRENETTMLRATFKEWPHDAVVQLAPIDLRDHLARLQFDELEGALTLGLTDSAYTLKGDFQSTSASATEPNAINIAVAATGSTSGAPIISGDINARLGDGALDATIYVLSENEYSVSLALTKVEARPWTALVSQADPLKGVEGFLNGVLTAETVEAQDRVNITAALTMNGFAYNGLSSDQCNIAGVLYTTKAFERFHVDEIHAEEDDFTYHLTLTDWDITPAPLDARGQIDSTFDLEVVAILADLPELRGECTVTGPVHIGEESIQADLSLRSDYIAYGALEAPYGTPLLASAEVALDTVKSQGAVRALSATLGEGTRIDSEILTFALSPLNIRGRIDTTSDLILLVDMGIVESVEGTLSAHEDFTYAGGTLESDWGLHLAAANLTLAGGVATMSDLSLTGTGAYDGELRGAGYMAAGEMSAAGARIRSFGGQAIFDGDAVRFPNTEAQLLGGSLAASIELGVLREGVPIHLSATFDAIDLAVLTEQVQPPKIKLTGIANGSGTFGYSLNGLSDFSLSMQSDTDFSLNREVVAELLQTDQFRQAIGAGKIEATLGKFLGSAPQRPFDSAILDLQLVPTETDATALLVEGQATLNSAKTKAYNGLNMTVNLAVDTATMAQTLKTLEEGAVETVGF